MLKTNVNSVTPWNLSTFVRSVTVKKSAVCHYFSGSCLTLFSTFNLGSVVVFTLFFFHQFAVRQIWSIPGPPFTHLPNLSLSVVHMLTQSCFDCSSGSTLIICKSLGGKTGRLLRRMWHYSRCHAHSVYLWLMKIRITRNRIKTQVASLSHKLVCCFCSFELRQEVCVWECWSWPSPVIQSGRCCRVLLFLFCFFPISFCTCSTIEHCTWAPYFTSCQSVKGSERWRRKQKCIYDAIMLGRLTCGSGFAAVSIAGIIQTYFLKKRERIKGSGRGDKMCL